MKRKIACIILAAMCLAVSACGGSGKTNVAQPENSIEANVEKLHFYLPDKFKCTDDTYQVLHTYAYEESETICRLVVRCMTKDIEGSAREHLISYEHLAEKDYGKIIEMNINGQDWLKYEYRSTAVHQVYYIIKYKNALYTVEVFIEEESDTGNAGIEMTEKTLHFK